MAIKDLEKKVQKEEFISQDNSATCFWLESVKRYQSTRPLFSKGDEGYIICYGCDGSKSSCRNGLYHPES